MWLHKSNYRHILVERQTQFFFEGHRKTGAQLCDYKLITLQPSPNHLSLRLKSREEVKNKKKKINVCLLVMIINHGLGAESFEAKSIRQMLDICGPPQQNGCTHRSMESIGSWLVKETGLHNGGGPSPLPRSHHEERL